MAKPKKKDRRYKKRKRKTRKVRDRHKARLEKQRLIAERKEYESEQERALEEMRKSQDPLALRLCIFGNLADSRYFTSSIEYFHVKRVLGINCYKRGMVVGGMENYSVDSLDWVANDFEKQVKEDDAKFAFVYFENVAKDLRRVFRAHLEGVLTKPANFRERLTLYVNYPFNND